MVSYQMVSTMLRSSAMSGNDIDEIEEPIPFAFIESRKACEVRKLVVVTIWPKAGTWMKILCGILEGPKEFVGCGLGLRLGEQKGCPVLIRHYEIVRTLQMAELDIAFP